MRLRASVWNWLAPSLVVAMLTATSAQAQGPEIFPLSQVRPGQHGYGLTVFQGTTPERFDFEVIGIAKNFLPKLDIILVKSDDPKLQLAGFAQGMSGSPLYIEGKVACAFSYGFRFNKIAMGGCTPIENMLAEAHHPQRRAAGPLAAAEPWAEFNDRMKGPPAMPIAPAGDGKMVPAAVPLVISGFTPAAFGSAQKIFAPYGLEVMEGGAGGGDPTRGPLKFEPGGSIAVELVTGDMSMAAVGTVTYMDEDRVIAFGHPLFGTGESDIPVAGAEVSVVVPSSQTAFKLASPTRVLGTLIQDRQSAIVADTSRKTSMVPVDIHVKSDEGEQQFHIQVISHRFLSPQLTTAALQSVVSLLTPDLAVVTVNLKSTIKIRGYDPLTFVDYIYSAEGLNANTIAAARGLKVLTPLLFNPFEPIHLDGIELDAEIAYKANYAEIRSLRLPDAELTAGEETYVDVVLRPYNGAEYTQRIPLTIPARLAGSTVKIEVVPGDAARADIAPPENFPQIMDALRHKTFAANVLVATVSTSDEGVTLGGKVLPDLPESALDTARPGATSRLADGYHSLVRVQAPTKQVVTGKQEIAVKIADRK